ncbi:armadillo-type protein [Crucibulum laeve]|uniref:Armadillo-type protein n=1 Tax=Crucibulum laeve TaxID=68775 RepID=A0A5C3LUV7_9AGAR|nr:armadillo-type protein [Crucibulum laeve]
MQSLLRWSIENSSPQDSAPSDRPPAERKVLDPGVIDMILGRPDSELMKEDMAVATDKTRSEADRVNALDHLEMLIEHIDNANDLEKLKLWEPLQSLLTSPDSTPEIKTQAIWVIGTALQNNPAAQDIYLSYDPLPTLLSFLEPSTSSTVQTRSKAIYALSGVLKHNAPAVEALGQPRVNGWVKLRDALADPEISVRRKAIFLLSALLIPTTQSSSSAQARQPPLLIQDHPDPSTSPVTPASTSTSIGPTSLSTSVAAHASGAPQSVAPTLHAPSLPSAPDPIHANSHAAHLYDPSRTSTSELTLTAFKAHGILDAVVSAVNSPLPYGEDGDNTDADADFEEKAVRLLHTYAVTCNGELSRAQKGELKKWVGEEKSKHGEAELLEKWSLTSEELESFVKKLD